MSFISGKQLALLQFYILFPLLFSCAPLKSVKESEAKDNAFTETDVKASQRLVGLNFTQAEIDTMYNYLLRNRANYDTMRTFALDYLSLIHI